MANVTITKHQRYLVFAYSDDATGGLRDLQDTFASLEDAERYAVKSLLKYDFAEIYDRIEGKKIYSISKDKDFSSSVSFPKNTLRDTISYSFILL